MSLIKKNQTFTPKSRIKKAGNNGVKPLSEKVVIPTTAVTPSESVVLTKVEIPGTEPKVKNIRKPREGSEMAQMVDSLKENGHLTHTPVDTVAEKKTPRAGSSMAQMLEDIESPNLGATFKPAVGPNGTIVTLDESGLVGLNSGAVNPLLTGMERRELDAKKNAEKTQGQGHGHEHSHVAHDSMLKAHLGTEIVEQVGHHAHHAAGHGAHTIKHVAHEASKQIAEHGGAVKHAVVQGTELGHSGDIGEIAEQVADLKHAATGHAAAGHAEAVAQNGSAAHTDAASHGAEAGHHLSSGLSTALEVGSVVSFGLAAPLAIMGVKEGITGGKHALKAHSEVKQARLQGDDAALKAAKEKRGDGVAELVEGVGTTAVGVRSAAAGAVMWEMAHTGSALGEVAGVASKALPVLGLVHAGVDVGLGIRDMAKGKKELKAAKVEKNEEAQKSAKNKIIDGGLKVAFGVAVGAAAVGGGVPATVAALGILAFKTGRKMVQKHKAKKAAKLAQQQAPKQIEPSSVTTQPGVEVSGTPPPMREVKT